MKSSHEFTKIAAALVKAQKKMGAATKDSKNPFFKSNYADLGAVMEVCKDPLNENGIAVLQPAFHKDGSHYVETYLIHESGEWISTEAIKLELTKMDSQGLGSAITYMRRYQLQSFLSIPAEDDDGNKAVGNKPKAELKALSSPPALIEPPKCLPPGALSKEQLESKRKFIWSRWTKGGGTQEGFRRYLEQQFQLSSIKDLNMPEITEIDLYINDQINSKLALDPPKDSGPSFDETPLSL